ncbi:MAG: D-alanyl-D-alanine carboxypeptidase family protein [Eggerthellaceae bacterium]
MINTAQVIDNQAESAAARRISERLFTSMLVCVLALVLCVPTEAFANVQKTDVIAGQTVQERGYSSSQCPSIDAKYAIATDQDGNVLFERSADTASQIASMTKIMTAIVAIEYNPDLDMEVTVTSTAAKIGESSAGLQKGDKMDMANALRAMMVASGNDAAQSIAAAVGAAMLQSEGGDSSDEDACVDRFVQAMNDKASELGLSNTVFTNPHGLDYGEYKGDLHSTARDVAKEVAYAMKIKSFRDIVKQDSVVVTVTRGTSKTGLTLTSTDTLLDTYKGTIGVKTGYTKKAGACYAGANKRNGKEYYVVVMDSSSEEQRFADAEAIWDWIYDNQKDYKLINCSETVSATINGKQGDYPLVAEVAHQDWPDRTIKATVADPDQTVNVYTWNGNVSEEVSYDNVTGTVHAGDKVGTITFKQHNETIATVDLVAAEDVEAPDFLTGIGIFWQRLAAQITGGSTVAESKLYNETPYLVDKSDQTSSVSTE